MGSKGIPSRTIAYVIRLGGAHAVVLIATSVQDDLTFASMMESVAASFHVSHGPATHGTTDASTVTLPGEDIRFVAPARWVGVPLDGIRTSLGASVAAAAPADRAYWQAWLDWFDSGWIRYALSAPPTENASIFVLLDERDRDFASSTERLLAETLGETAARDPGARRPIDVPAGQAIMATAPFATAVQVSIVVVLMRLPGERTLAMIGLGRSTDDAFEGVVRDLAESVAVG